MSRDALVVGINTYQHLPSLHAPANDAESVARCLESFGECRVLRMPEAIRNHKPAVSQQAVVTTKLLEESLIRLFKPTGKNIPHTAIFYYSGHGLQRNAGIQEGYLATSDVNPAVGNYGLSLYWLRRLLQESPVRQRVIILDCCNSGEFFNILEADPGAKSGTDRLFMAASREYEEAFEALDGSHSVFTQALLSGLNPYKVKGGLVNGHSLTDTVARQLKGELQQPLFESSGGEIVLTRLAGLAPVVQSSKVSTLERLKHLSYGFCPFQGLAPLDTTHASLFFGRETLTQTLVKKVGETRFCALVGASGIGKTSILRAGLMHQLNQQTQSEHYPNWDIRYLTPGQAPLNRLAEAFVEPKVKGIQRAEHIRQAEAILRNGGQGLGPLVQAMAQPHGASTGKPRRIVIVVDQFEEIFSEPSSPALDQERQLMVDCLIAAVTQEHLPVHVVLGLRANYLGSLQRFSALYPLVADHGIAVPAMTYDQVKSTIVGPLEKVGLRYDANLVYTLLLDVVGAPGELALLQMALKEVWQHRELDPQGQNSPRLTLEAYAEMGGIRHLLTQRANQLYDHLPQAEQHIAERIFLSLCEAGEGVTLTRRQVQLSELVTASMPQTQVLAVLNKLVAAGLVVAQMNASRPVGGAVAQPATLVPAWALGENDRATEHQGSLTKLLQRTEERYICHRPNLTPHFDIAHESLLRTWPPLQTWLQNSQARLKQQRAIETAAQEWYGQQCPAHPDYFLTKSRLAEAKALQSDHPDRLSTQAVEYLKACSLYARRCTRKRYLMKLLIPMSMATGMLTAYGHSVVTQPSQAWKIAQTDAQPELAPGPTFRSTEPVPPAPLPSSVPVGRPSPQAGMVRTYLLDLVSLSSAGTRSQIAPLELGGLSPTLPLAFQTALDSAHPWAGKAQSIARPPSVSLQELPLGQGQLDKVAEWTLPTDSTKTVEVWCLRDRPEPTCFTINPLP
jgi:hypothetical protein